MTTWEQMNTWLPSIGLTDATTGCNFWHRESSNIIDEDQTIASTMDDENSSTTIDVLDVDAVTTIELSYDKKTMTHRILKSCPVTNLLHNQRYLQQLDVEVSSAELVLALTGETEQTILDNDALQRSVRYFAETTNVPLHFKICVCIHIFRYNDPKEQQLTISHRNITVATLLSKIKCDEDYKYLASSETNMVLSENTNLSRISGTTFILGKEDQTCLVSIERSRDSATQTTANGQRLTNQRYLLSATMADIYKQNRMNDDDQFLLFENDFVPSGELCLSSFLPITSESIEFVLITRNLPTCVIITRDEDETPIQFHCESTISIDRIREMICHWWKLNQRFYRLFLTNGKEIDDDFTLKEIDDSVTDFQLKLLCIAQLKCSITYQKQTVVIPTADDILASVVLQEALEKLGISTSEMDTFELNFVYDPQCPRSIELDLSIEDICSDLPKDSKLIPFQLERKEDWTTTTFFFYDRSVSISVLINLPLLLENIRVMYH